MTPGLGARATQDARDSGARQRRLLGGGGNEALDFRPLQIEPGGCGGCGGCGACGVGVQQPGAQNRCAAQPGLQTRADHYEPMSFRCEYMDIRIPKPASRVTMEVPP